MAHKSKYKFLFVAEVPGNLPGGIPKHFKFIGQELSKMGHIVDYIFIENMPEPFLPITKNFAPDICRRSFSSIIRHLHQGYDLIYISVNSCLFYNLYRKISILRACPPTVGMTFGVDERYWKDEVRDYRGEHGYEISLRRRLITAPLRNKVIEYGLRTSDHIVCVSTQDRDFIINNYNVASSKVTFIPVGVAQHFFLKHTNSNPKPRLLFVGTWIWRKGIRYLRDAFLRVLREEPRCKLSLVGTFVEAGVILKDFPKYAWENIRVLPVVDEQALIEEYRSHDIFVLASLFEGMPLSIAEAMAAQLPVVTTNTCGMIDLIENNEDGILVPLRDSERLATAILKLIFNPSKRQRLGMKAQIKIRNHNWDKIASKFLDVFEQHVIGR